MTTVRESRILTARRAIAGMGEDYWYLKRLKSEELGAIAEAVVDALFTDHTHANVKVPDPSIVAMAAEKFGLAGVIQVALDAQRNEES